MRSPPVVIVTYGRALHGARFHSLLAAELGVNEKTVRRWCTGESPVPDDVWQTLRTLAAKKAGELAALAALNSPT